MAALIAMTRTFMADWLDAEEGQGMVEYVLIIGTISLVIVFAFLATDIGGAITGLASKVTDAIDTAPAS
jgi:Flp pilus assembly pilin Flp